MKTVNVKLDFEVGDKVFFFEEPDIFDGRAIIHSDEIYEIVFNSDGEIEYRVRMNCSYEKWNSSWSKRYMTIKPYSTKEKAKEALFDKQVDWIMKIAHEAGLRIRDIERIEDDER